MNETMTVSQALRITAENLSAIAVPRALNQTIGIPIDQAIGNIVNCIKALEEAEQEAAEKEQDKQDEEPQDEEPQEEKEDGNADAE